MRNYMQTHPFVKSILITEDEIQKKIQDLAKIINEHYKNSRQPLILVGVLRGCINFITDLMRYLEIDCAVDFMYVESYSGNTKQSSTPKIRMDIFNDIKDRDVLIVEDIIDSGKTLIKIVEHLQKKQPNSLRIMTFLDKKCQRKINIEAD